MNRTLLFILPALLFTLSACQKENPQTIIEETATNFCEAFYNFNYPVAKEWSTPSSLSYLSFLASNLRQEHLDRLRKQGPLKVSILTSAMEPNAERATAICQIKDAYIIHPISGNTQHVSSLQDTLQLIKEDGKWLVRKDIPLQSGKQNRD